MGGIKTLITGDDSGKKAQRRAEEQARAAELRAKQAQDQQEAVQKRELLKAGEREAELEKTKAAQRRAVVARRGGRSALAFNGPVTNLKSKLGE